MIYVNNLVLTLKIYRLSTNEKPLSIEGTFSIKLIIRRMNWRRSEENVVFWICFLSLVSQLYQIRKCLCEDANIKFMISEVILMWFFYFLLLYLISTFYVIFWGNNLWLSTKITKWRRYLVVIVTGSYHSRK